MEVCGAALRSYTSWLIVCWCAAFLHAIWRASWRIWNFFSGIFSWINFSCNLSWLKSGWTAFCPNVKKMAMFELFYGMKCCNWTLKGAEKSPNLKLKCPLGFSRISQLFYLLLRLEHYTAGGKLTSGHVSFPSDGTARWWACCRTPCLGPWWLTTGIPKRQIQWEKMASATVSASLFGRATSSTYFCAGVGHTQNVFFVSSGCDQGSEQICMNFLIWLSADWQQGQQIWCRMNIRSVFLTFVTGLGLVWNRRIHIRPPIVLL